MSARAALFSVEDSCSCSSEDRPDKVEEEKKKNKWLCREGKKAKVRVAGNI